MFEILNRFLVDNSILIWDPKSGLSAILGGVISGLSLIVVFYLGVIIERSKLNNQINLEDEKKAVSVLFKLREFFDSGLKSAQHVVNAIPDGVETQKFSYVYPLVESYSLSSRVEIDELYFLIKNNKISLFQELLEMQNWSESIVRSVSLYSEMRSDWDVWLPQNSITKELEDGSLQSSLTDQNAVVAKIKAKKMDDLINAIVDIHSSHEHYFDILNQYIKECKILYGVSFASIKNFSIDEKL